MALTTDSSVADLFDNPAAAAVLTKHMPAMAEHPQIGMAKAMGLSLKAVAGFSDGKITDDMLAAVAADLAAL